MTKTLKALKSTFRVMVPTVVFACAAFAQAPQTPQAPGVTSDPFPQPIPATDGAIVVNFVEFAVLPNSGAGQAPRMMLLDDEPGTKRLFVNDMTGLLYSVSYDGKTVTPYLDMNAHGVAVQSQNFERGFQSFAFHPQFNQRGARGYGKFYTAVDTSNMTAPSDYKSGGTGHTHDSLLLEWTAKNPAAPAYDGGPPRELLRIEHPFVNHNLGRLTFNPLATPKDADYGLLYVGYADGGSGGDPLNNSQKLSSIFGKILRIDPLGNNSPNKKYGVPASNPFAGDNDPETLGEIYAYGIRNPQGIFWDSKSGNMFMSDIGQNTVEKISLVTSGADLGWNVWEGSYRFVSGRGGGVSMTDPGSDANVTFPVVEWGQIDPLLQPSGAAIGGIVYRQPTIPVLTNKLIFGDNPSGEIFYVDADKLPKGGQDPIRRILLNDKGMLKKFLTVIQEKNTAQGRKPATRADLRFGEGANGEIFLLNKQDGTIRMLVK